MTRADRAAEELAKLEYAEARTRWNCRLRTPNGAVVVDVWGLERRVLVELLADAVFTYAPGRNRGAGLTLELERATPGSIL